MKNTDKLNTRILIIDDEEMVRDNIEEILVPKKTLKNEKLSNAADLLFGDDNEESDSVLMENKTFPDFIVDKAVNGKQGFEKVAAAVQENRPFAVIFLDMRMPGWDGLETAKRIRQVDTKAEIIIVTAYSDHSIDKIVQQAGKNVGYHVKPYNSDEILQIATKGVNDYNKLRNLEDLIATTGRITLGENQLNSLLRNIFDQLARYIGTENAIMGTMGEGGKLDFLFTVGNIENELNESALLGLINQARHNDDSIIQEHNVVLAMLKDYPVFAVLEPNETLKTEKIYLIQLFIQNATQAIENAHLQEELIKKEKLTAAGNALGMLMHDLRTPIKNIPQITSFLREDGANPDLLDMLDESSQQASDILDDFLDFVRETPIDFEVVPLKEVVENAIKLANNRIKIEPIEIEVSLDQKANLAGDPSKLKRLIINIISNAVDVLFDLKVTDPKISVKAEIKEDHACLSISDNGPGIPEDLLPTLFEPFTTKNKKDGTGLGLTIVKQYVEAHGGEINVHNDNGAVFKIKLPLFKD
jgi:two-component system NtrC family sensor kinase